MVAVATAGVVGGVVALPIAISATSALVDLSSTTLSWGTTMYYNPGTWEAIADFGSGITPATPFPATYPAAVGEIGSHWDDFWPK